MRKGIYSSTLIMVVGSVVAKIFSAVYRIILTRILGGEGIGVYQLIFPVYSLFVVITTAGIPMAISKVVARNVGSEKQVLKKCIKYMSLLAFVCFVVLICLSDVLATMQGNENLKICYIILAPSILIVGVASVLRGYFQGMRRFVPSATSNIVEQFSKLVFGLILSLAFISKGLICAVIAVVVGLVISEVCALAVLCVFYKAEKPTLQNTCTITFSSLFKDVWPIVATNVILPITAFVDSLLVVNLLGINFTNKMSVFLYGLESGAVNSLTMLPTIFSYAFASVVLPNLADMANKYNNTLKLTSSLRIILIICLPCVLCFVFLPDKLILLLYGDRLSAFGVEGLAVAYRLLVISGLGITFLAINQIYSSCLQAIDKRIVSVRNLIIGVVCKYVIELIFLPSVMVNIYALALSNTVCYVVVFVLNYLEVKQNFSLGLNNKFIIKLVFSNFVMITFLLLLTKITSGNLNILLSIILSGFVYLICLIDIKILDKREIALLKYKLK